MSAIANLAPSGLTRIIDAIFASVAAGIARLSRGGHAFNMPATARLSLANRLTHLLRLALLILACRLDPEPLRARAVRPAPSRLFRPRAAAFRLFARPFRLHDLDAPAAPAPAGFLNTARDPVLAMQRKLDALRRALTHPVAYARRMARRLPRQLMVIGASPPRRRPRDMTSDQWLELVDTWREAWFQLHEFRRRTRESAAAGASAS